MTAPISINYGEAKRREAAAKAKAERRKVDPDVRAIRAGILERREALMVGQQEAAKAERDATPDALRAVLGRGTVDELAEIARMISRLDGRRLQDLANEIFREKSRTGYVQPPESAVQTRSGRRATSAA